MWHLKNGMYERAQAIYNSVCLCVCVRKEKRASSKVKLYGHPERFNEMQNNSENTFTTNLQKN